MIVAADDRGVDLARFGRAIRALRMRRGWRQQDLAEAARLSRSQVGRVERGERAGLTLEAVDAVAIALGATADLVVRWRGEGLDRLVDEAHARLVDEVVRRLVALGWDVAVEVSFSRSGERGSIDVLAFHPGSRALVVIEVKSVVPDLQAMFIGLDRKSRLAPAIARERGWYPDTVARLLVVWDTRTNRRRLGAHDATVRAALPAGTRDVTSWLAAPSSPGVRGIWFVTDGRPADGIVVRRHRVRISSSPARSRPGP
jgi:transcriptional regulator with XRE-family HTH domain